MNPVAAWDLPTEPISVVLIEDREAVTPR